MVSAIIAYGDAVPDALANAGLVYSGFKGDDTAETVCGMEPGTLTKYLNELKTCQDKDAIEDGAREINSKGNGVVDLHMSDAGKERVKNVPVGTHAAVKAKMPTRPNIQKIGRNRF